MAIGVAACLGCVRGEVRQSVAELFKKLSSFESWGPEFRCSQKLHVARQRGCLFALPLRRKG